MQGNFFYKFEYLNMETVGREESAFSAEGLILMGMLEDFLSFQRKLDRCF